MKIVVTSGKGGEGKSTLALLLAKFLSFKGYAVELFSKDLLELQLHQEGKETQNPALILSTPPTTWPAIERLQAKEEYLERMFVLDLPGPMEFQSLESVQEADFIVVLHGSSSLSQLRALYLLSYLETIGLKEKVISLAYALERNRKHPIPEYFVEGLERRSQRIKSSAPRLTLLESLDLKALSPTLYVHLSAALEPLCSWITRRD